MRLKLVLVCLVLLAAAGLCFAGGARENVGAAGPVEIGWWTINVDEKGTYEPMIAAFEKSHPNIKVVPGWVETTSYTPSLMAALAAGKGPDVFQGWPESQIGVLARNKQALDLTSYAKELNIYPNLLNPYQGKIYAVPSGIGMMALFYNKDIFRKYGLALPQTVNDFAAMAQKLKGDLIVPLAYGSGDEWNADKVWFALAGQTAGDKMIQQADAGKTSWTAPELLRPMQIMADMRDKGVFPQGFQGMNWQDVKNVFYQGKAAMWLFGNWQIQIFIDEKTARTADNPQGLDLGVVPFPSVGGGKSANTIGAAGPYWVVNQDSKHQSAALELVRYFCAGDGLNLYVSAYKLPPAPYDMGKIKNFVDPFLSLQSFFAGGAPIMTTDRVSTPEVAQELVVQIQGLNNHMTTPEQAMLAVQKASENAKR